MKNLSILLLFWALSVSKVAAHALWIETSAKGVIGKAQEIKIFYGEYADGEVESVEDWYSDVKEFKLWLVSPEGEKTELKCLPHEEHYTAVFTPEKEGAYTLAIGHSARDLGGSYLYQFNASAVVFVGNPAKGTEPLPEENQLYVLLDKSNSNKPESMVKGRVFFKGKPASEVTLGVASPEGWSKNFKTDEEGSFAFKAIWKGDYLLEASLTENTQGEHFGNTYENIWRCATVLTTVK